MAFLSARATRIAVFVLALSGGGLWALYAIDAKADPPAMDGSSPCAEGRALFAAKLAYLESRVAPEPSQQDAWRRFTDAMRATAGDADRACTGEPPPSPSADAGERLKRMQRHAAAMEAMFGAMASAYEAIAPQLTTAQRDILSRNIVPPPPPPPSPPFGHGMAPRLGEAALSCGRGGPGFHDWAPQPPL